MKKYYRIAALVLAACVLVYLTGSVFAETLKNNKDFFIQGKKVRFQGGTDIEFHATGDVERGFLAQDTALPVGQQAITFRRHTMIAFYRSGNVHMGFLGDWTVLNYKGKKLTAPPGSYVEFDPTGELIEHKYNILDIMAMRCRNAETRVINSDSPLYFTPDGRFVIAKNVGLPCSLWDMQNGTCIKFFEVIPRAFSSDGKYFLTAADADDGMKTVRIWNAKTWKAIKTVEGAMERIHYMDFTADSRKILAVNRDTEIKIWNAATGRLLKTVQMEKGGHKGHVFTMKFSPDGRFLASGGEDRMVRIWETDAGNLVKIINPNGGYISALDFSPDGKILAASCQHDNKIMLWNTANWNLIRTINVKSRYLYHTEFSPDGRFMLSAGQSAGGFDDNWQENLALKLWDVKTGKLIRCFSGHHKVFNASFSPDGKRIVSASTRDKSFKLWDVDTGRLIATFMTIGKDGDWMLFTPDGYYNCSDNTYNYESMSFSTGAVKFTLEDFRLYYYKPDMVARYMKGDIPPPPQYVLFEMSHFEPEQNKRSWYVRYEYDNSYRRVKCRRYKKDGSPDGYYLYEYDSAERIVKESYYSNNGSLINVLIHEYNQANEKVKSEFYDAKGKVQEILKYEYGNRVAMFTGLCLKCHYYDTDGNLLRYSEYWYDDLNRISTETFYNAARKTIYKHKYEYGDLTSLFYHD